MGEKRVLIIKLSAIGDVVHTIPFLETLKYNFPLWEIDWVLEDRTFPLVEKHPMISRVLMVKRRDWQKGKGILGLFRFIRELRSVSYDMVIDLQGLLKSGLIAGIARGDKKIGLSIQREHAHVFYNTPLIEVDINRHALLRTLDVALALGAKRLNYQGIIPIPEKERGIYRYRLSRLGLEPKNFVTINPVAKWDTKLWYEERFGKLADEIREATGLPIIFTGSKDDTSYIKRTMSLMKTGAIDLSGQIGLRELAYLLESSKILISTDTGPMHMAAAMKCPVVAIFGPTDPNRTGPYGTVSKVVRARLHCNPCLRKSCKHRACMDKISVGEVFDACMELITERGT